MIYGVFRNEHDIWDSLIIFDKRENAEAYVRAFGGILEAFPFNPEFPHPPNGMTRYYFCIYKTPNVHIRRLQDHEDYNTLTKFDQNPFIRYLHNDKRPQDDAWTTYIWANDEDHARRIAQAYRVRILSGNTSYYPIPEVT